MHAIALIIRRHLPEIHRIERLSFSNPWTEDDFQQHFAYSMTIGKVLLIGERIAGFIIYELPRNGDLINIKSVAVHPEYSHQGAGSILIRHVTDKLKSRQKRVATAFVRESNLSAQLFLQRLGFRCTGTLRAMGTDHDRHLAGEDAYCFEYAEPQLETNRLSKFMERRV